MREGTFGCPLFCLGDGGAIWVMADHGDHSACDPDTCFTAKLRYWRAGGGAPMQFTYGRSTFSGPTIRERQDKMIAEAAEIGKEIRPVNPRYDRVGS